MFCAVLLQRQKLTTLRTEESATATTPAPDRAEPQRASEQNSKLSGSASSGELLQLRSTVTRLESRKRELAGSVAENKRLQVQLAAIRTNAPSGGDLPPGYIRKSHAQMVGYSTPENTVQSLLWAVRNHDLTNLVRAFTPSSADRLQAEFASNTPEVFWQNADKIPGIGVLGSETLPDGALQLEIVGPGEQRGKVRLQAIGGEWKLDGPF